MDKLSNIPLKFQCSPALALPGQPYHPHWHQHQQCQPVEKVLSSVLELGQDYPGPDPTLEKKPVLNPTMIQVLNSGSRSGLKQFIIKVCSIVIKLSKLLRKIF